MAATGGGKIRTRRYHIVSKPYAKGKQQPGLISRVTDTVKSIVPSWLQKYFKNGELTEGGEARVEVEQNNVAPPPNGNEETVPLRHGRNSPEPSTSNAEPSTSRASLNFQDALSRPPLNRSHLHFPSQDGSPALGGSNSLFSQPSTSTAPFPASPFAVASNFSLVKEIKDSSSQHEDDNISTTSGFSSRASDKDVPTSKTAPLLWSPETERTHSGSQPAQHSLKKPAFNLSVFGTSSSSAMNSSVLNSSQLGDSPFYQGKTTYGGAAAARTARARPGTPYQAPVRRQIKAKPAGAQPCGVTSATARRILQSLERMSSPLADAKRIPSTVSSPLSTLNHPDPDVSPFQSKKKKLEPALPPVQKLVIPTAAAVTGNRSMSFRPSLTPGSVSRTGEKSVKETPVRSPKIPDAPSVPPSSTSSLSYPLSSTPATSSTGAGGGKMKRERSVRPSSKKPDDEVGEVPKLPAISLPISNFTLPTFSFSSPPSTSSHTPSSKPLTSVPEEPLVRKEASPVSMAPVLPFIFSSPIVKATAASPTSFSPSSGFTFSAPTMKTAPSASNGNPGTTVAVKAAASEGNEEFEGPFKPAKALKQGSVLDILKGPGFASPAQSSSVPDKTLCTASEGASSNSLSGFKPASESRNCDASIVQNKPSDKESVACLAPRPNTEFSSKLDNKPTKAPTASLTTLFAPPPGSWECDTCLVRNKPEVIKCVACDTAKPGTGVKPTLTLPPASEVSSIICAPSSSATTTISISTTSGPLGFGDKFKKPEGAWDCDVCMVQNKAQDIKCVACQNAKPGTTAVAPSSLAPPPKTASTGSLLGFGDKFKKPEGSWDCDVCCVQNKAEDQQCVACQSAKPGAKVASKDFGSSFGTQSSSTESTSSSFKFGTSSSNTASSGLKFGGTFSNSSNSVGFQMGNNSSDSTTSSAGFKFGASSSDASGGFKFGGALTEPASTGTGSSGGFKFDGSSDGFKFGTASAPVSTSEESSSTGFKFGGSSGVSIGSGAASTSTTVSGGFSFGLSKPEEKAAPNSTFSFSAPKVKGDKDDGPSSAETVSAASTTSTAVTNTIPVFGKPSVVEPATAAPSFGETAAKEPATPAFTFGKPEEKKDNSTPSTGFVFSAAKEADKPAPSMGFSFSKPEPPKEIPKPTFTFGKLAESTETPKPAFGFGQNATDTAAPKPAFGFMANSSSTPASSSPAPSLFGAQSSSTSAPTSAPNSTFVFGQTSSSDAPPAKTFMFGQQQDSQPASAGLPAAPAPTQPFLFGSAANSATFSFGAAAATTPASAAPAPSATPSPFVFTSATSSSGFGFGQTPAFGQGSSQTSAPAFGSAAPSFSATASPAPAFGAKPSAAPAFGQQPNSTPVFGSSTASAGQGGFQFGGASAFGTSARNSSEFTFGASGTAANSASSQSMSAQPVAPGGGFNFTQAPAFNIGSTKNSFSPAPTGQHAIPGRKIKTAVRRRK
ncbi:nuclear pore complex protein Nup153 isoform X1 [Pygocentrus nattereri]|uniref:Nuclear pore complex protein Nup153 n=1 Tax=Pygocentrus nattereri TaxID=42514 RepID=A0A3B4D0Y3_PYGNA|nr:nuclear pore complex protein Nup153 isoform X1 [Pygocentrus nattereri]